jgi:hypothetical protein
LVSIKDFSAYTQVTDDLENNQIRWSAAYDILHKINGLKCLNEPYTNGRSSATDTSYVDPLMVSYSEIPHIKTQVALFETLVFKEILELSLLPFDGNRVIMIKKESYKYLLNMENLTWYSATERCLFIQLCCL